jgi:hypothetical protein
MTAEIKLPPMPEWAKMDNLNGMVPSEIRSALNEFGREAVRLNVQGGSVAPQLAVSPYLLSDIRELAAYAEGSKSPRMVHASRAAWAWLEGAQLAEPDEPNWRHPKIQGLIGSEARLRITIDLIWRILEDPNQEFGPSDMEYWDTIHDKLKEALSTKPAAPQPAQQPVDEREAFEAIFLPGSGVTFDRDANGFYKGVFVSEAWKVWQARAALSAPQAAPNDDGTLPTYTDELELRYIEACEERDHLRQVLAAQAAQAAAAQPLTESAIQQIGLDIPSQHHPGWLIEFARAIERAHGITED